MHTIAPELRRRGVNARTVDPGTELDLPDRIYLLPESGAPPNDGSPVVRWLLGTSRQYTTWPRSFDVTWHPELFPDCEELRVPLIESDLFYPGAGPRSGVVAFGGKARVPEEAAWDSLITYKAPGTRRELADVLRGAEYLACYDNMTHLTVEAVVCGCPVVLPDPDAPSWWDDVPGVCRDVSELEQAKVEVVRAAGWVENEHRRHAGTIDRFCESLALLGPID